MLCYAEDFWGDEGDFDFLVDEGTEVDSEESVGLCSVGGVTAAASVVSISAGAPSESEALPSASSSSMISTRERFRGLHYQNKNDTYHRHRPLDEL